MCLTVAHLAGYEGCLRFDSHLDALGCIGSADPVHRGFAFVSSDSACRSSRTLCHQGSSALLCRSSIILHDMLTQ